MHTVEISKDQWSQLMDELGRGHWNFIYLVLSSTPSYVFLTTKKGYHHEPDRTKKKILNKYSFIGEIHQEVLKYDSRGKRFTIKEKEVRLADGNVLICKVKFI